jgi:predicted transcriptional regulator YdeE
MNVKATTVQMPDLHLVVVRAMRDQEPEIKAAWQTLESRLSSLKGRKFYGACYKEESEFVYYAGLEPLDTREIELLGFQTLTVKGGKYARVRLADWHNHTDQIGPIFDHLRETLPTNRSGPNIEHYRSQRVLDLLVPLAEEG